MRNIPYRICISLLNVFFPPLSVLLLTGLGHDTAINSLLFLAGVLPSHVHCFYLSMTYFHRRRKARKGRYPGGSRACIASRNVLNGGLTEGECERRLWREQNGEVGEKRLSGRSGKTESRRSRRSKKRSNKTGWRDAETQGFPVQQDVDMSFGRPHVQRIQTWRSDVPGGYVEELSPALPPRPGVG
jgi:uncharacterized membrane protein YqaE (UPF0057 family)